ncbi:hypothetical protein NBRC10512_000042 [Rhodotorula toruloides]|uniref:RHTO0S09e04632g1_1 n=1 Tax=Rhodotorula toruloides TaxID=5286 RepID=A0A061B3S0_RHOTO|nr:RHTO0S09e04632g1_1 [Rhodotorula toruloides]
MSKAIDSPALSQSPTLEGADDERKSALATLPSSDAPASQANKPPAGPPGPMQQDPSLILQGKKLAVVFTAMLLALFLIAVDQSILATALPRIASDFNAFDKQGWCSSAFVLTQTAFILWFGQFLRIYSAKWTLVGCILLFEVGSIICGAAPNVMAIIWGRAISGVGAAGMFVSMLQILAQVTRLEDRPKLFGLFGGCFGAASVIGPLAGGGLTDHAGWRWVFWLNLCVGAPSLVGCTFLLKSMLPIGADPTKRSPRDLLRQTLRMDWIGATLVLGAVTALVYALQTGGNQKPWSDGGVVACFVVAGVLCVAIFFWMRYKGDSALVPPAVFQKSPVSVCGICGASFFNRCSLLMISYAVPVFFQVTRHHDATKSGVDLLAYMLSVVITVILAGRVVSATGRYWYFLVGAPAFGAVGAGLLYTVTPSTSTAKIIGYQILCGVGTGATLQNSLFAMQAEFRDEMRLVAQATGVASFSQFLGGTVSLAIEQAALSTQLAKNFPIYAPQAPLAVIKESPLEIYSLPSDIVPSAIFAYVKSLKIVFVIPVAYYGLGIISALFINNISIKPPAAAKGDAKDAEEGKIAPVEEPKEKAEEDVAKGVAEGEVARSEGV